MEFGGWGSGVRLAPGMGLDMVEAGNGLGLRLRVSRGEARVGIGLCLPLGLETRV